MLTDSKVQYSILIYRIWIFSQHFQLIWKSETRKNAQSSKPSVSQMTTSHMIVILWSRMVHAAAVVQ